MKNKREVRNIGTAEVRTKEGEPPRITGLAAPHYDGTDATQYELWPGVVERYSKDAFAEAVAGDVRVLWNHDSSQVLGRTTAGTAKLWISERGLEYSADPPATQLGRDVTTLIARGDVSGSSVGMIVEKEEWSREGQVEVRTITKASLLDVSPVTFPAYEGTTSGLRSADTEVAKAAYEAAIKAREEEHARGMAMMEAELSLLNT